MSIVQKYIFINLFLFYPPHSELCFSQTSIAIDNELITQIEEQFLSFHLNSLDTTLPSIPNHATRQFYIFHQEFYRFLSSQSEASLDNMESKWEDAISAIKELSDEDPLKEVMLAEVYGKRGIWEFMQKDYLTSIWYIRLSKNHIRNHAKDFPNNIENQKLRGLLNVLFGAVPKKYKWITRTLGFTGDVNLGIKQLNIASQQSPLLRLEAILLYYYATKNLENQPNKAILDLEQQIAQSPPSIVLDYCLIAGYMSLKQNEKAYKLLSKRDRYFYNPRVQFIPMWDFYYGKAYYYQANYQQTQKYLKRFLSNHKGDLFRTDAMFRMGMSYILSNNYPKGKSYLENLLHLSASDLEEDQYAFHMSQTFVNNEPSDNTKNLFRARNAYDGGYYQKALTLLDHLQNIYNTLDKEELTYLHYLLGRIYHSTGETSLAEEHYNKCISQPDNNTTRWLQAYSCYYIAQLASEHNKRTLAYNYFNKALSYDDYFYQPSLENQCKLALKRLE